MKLTKLLGVIALFLASSALSQAFAANFECWACNDTYRFCSLVWGSSPTTSFANLKVNVEVQYYNGAIWNDTRLVNGNLNVASQAITLSGPGVYASGSGLYNGGDYVSIYRYGVGSFTAAGTYKAGTGFCQLY